MRQTPARRRTNLTKERSQVTPSMILRLTFWRYWRQWLGQLYLWMFCRPFLRQSDHILRSITSFSSDSAMPAWSCGSTSSPLFSVCADRVRERQRTESSKEEQTSQP